MLLLKNRNVTDPIIDDHERSKEATELLSWLFNEGSFHIEVIGLGNPRLPVSAKVVIHKTQSEVFLNFNEWLLLNRKYYSPEQLNNIRANWVNTY